MQREAVSHHIIVRANTTYINGHIFTMQVQRMSVILHLFNNLMLSLDDELNLL